MSVLADRRTVFEEMHGRDRAAGASVRLAVDARMWKTGIGRYTLSLLRAMRQVGGEFRVCAIVRAEAEEMIAGLCTETRVVEAPVYGLGEQYRIPRAARGCDLLHVPHYNVPALFRGPMVVTIHDLTHLTEPEFRNSAKAWLYARPMLRIAAKKARQMITVSEYSKRQIVTFLRVAPQKVSVIHNGVDEKFRPGDCEKAAADVRQALKLDRPYLFYLGNLRPHKNVGRLLRAFALLRRRGRRDLRLALAGEDQERMKGVLAQCARLGIGEAVRHLRWAPDDLLPQLYRTADLVVMPSTSEGFGLPVLEAMACGTPVACSKAASLPEVGGDAVEYFDPYSVEKMAAAMERVLDSAERREELREKGLRQAAKFTWEECARKHLEVYRRVLTS